MAKIGGDGLHFESSLDNESFNKAVEESIKKMKNMGKITSRSGDEIDAIFRETVKSVNYTGNAIDKTSNKTKKATNELGGISKAAHSAGGGFDKATSGAQRTGSVFQDIGNKSTVLDRELKQLAGTIATIFTVQQASQFVNDIISVRGEIESLEVSFETLVGNKEVAQEMFQSIREFAVNTPMQMNDLAKGAQTMLSFNIAAEEIMPNLRMLGDVSMGNKDKFNSLTLAFSQITATGHLMGQDLLQLINAGFNPLTVISEKTGKSISILKEEMSQGAISANMVKEAFKEVTSEGGIFYNMLNKQSTTLNGAISNLQGSITDMMNDIGEANEGPVRGAVDLSTLLVKNYKTVGDTLEWLIVTYGSYRAALALSIAADNAKASSTTVLAIAQGKLSKAIKAAMLSMKAANATLLSNPIYLVVAAVASLAYGIYKLKKAEDEEAEARAKMISDLEDEEDKLDALKESIDATVRGTNERKEAINKLQSAYPGYLKNMLTEKSTAEEVSEAYKQLKRDVMDARLEQMKQKFLDKPLTELNEHKSRAIKFASSALNNDYNLTADQRGEIQGRIYKAITQAIDDGDKLYSGLLQETVSEVAPNAKADKWAASSGSFSRYASFINDDINAIKAAKKEFNSFTKGYYRNDTPSKRTESTSNKSFKQLDDDLIKSQVELNKLKEEGSTIDAGVLKDAEAKVIASKNSILEREKDLKVISDVSSRVKELKKAQQGTILNSTEYNDYESRIERLQAKISNPTNKSGDGTKVSGIGLNSVTEEESMRDYLALYGDYQEKRLAISQQYDKKIEASTTKGAVLALEKEKSIALKKVDDSIVDQQALEDKAMQSYLLKYGNYQEKKEAIIRQYDSKIEASTTKGDKLALIEDEKRALKSLEDGLVNDSKTISVALGDMSKKSVLEIQKIIDRSKILLDYLSGNSNKNTDDMISLGFTPEELNLSTEGIERLKNAIGNLQGNIANRSPWTAFVAGVSDAYKEITKKGATTGEMGAGIQKMGTTIQGFSGELAGLGDALGNTVGGDFGEKAADVVGALNGIGTTAKGVGEIMQGDVVGGLTDVINGLMDTADSVDHLFSTNTEAAYQSAKKKYQAYMDVLDDVVAKQEELVLSMKDADFQNAGNSYEKAVELIGSQEDAARVLGKQYMNAGAGWRSHSHGIEQKKDMSNDGWNEAKDALGGDFYSATNERMTGLFDLMSEQLSTLKRDAPIFWAELNEDTKTYLQQIIDSTSALNDIEDKRSAALTETDFSSFRDGFLSTLEDMSSDVDDFSKDFQENLQHALMSSLMENAYDDKIKELYAHWAELTKSDGELTEVEAAILKKEQEDLSAKMLADRNSMKESFGWKTDDEQQTALSGTQISASEETVSAANGQMNAIRINQIEMKNAINNQLAALNRIATNTSYNKHLEKLEMINANIAKLSSNSSSNGNVNLRSTGKQL